MSEFSLKLANGNSIDVQRQLDGSLDVHVTDPAGELLGHALLGHDAADTEDRDQVGELFTALESGTYRLVKTCETCGGRFHAKRDAARYCSTSCKLKAARARAKTGPA